MKSTILVTQPADPVKLQRQLQVACLALNFISMGPNANIAIRLGKRSVDTVQTTCLLMDFACLAVWLMIQQFAPTV